MMKKFLLLFMGVLMGGLFTSVNAQAIEATPVDNLSTYTGSDPFVYDRTTGKYYAYNNLNQYEEYGVYQEVTTLKVAGGGVSEIEYIKAQNDAYINLNYIPKANSKAICTIDAETGAAWKAIYGCGYYSGGWKDRFCFFTTNATINLGGETGNSEAMRYGEKIVTVLDAVAGKMDIYEADGETLIGTITDSPKTADCKTPLYVFAQNKDVPGGGTQTDCYNMLTKLYGLQLYEGDDLVMDLVPAVDAEGNGGLKDKITGTFYGSANNGTFELSADGQAIAAAAGISVYDGKLVVNTANNHEYKWKAASEQWEDMGALTYQAVSEIGTEYKNLSNWSHDATYDSTFGVNVYDEVTGSNTLNPYEGKDGWEPLWYKLSGLTKGETYRVSFSYTGTDWHSWSSYTTLPFMVWDAESVPNKSSADTNGSLAYVLLPNTATTDLACSRTFVANHDFALLCIQFGVVDDGSHDPAFAFTFTNFNVEKQVFPAAYQAITWADPVKYTALEYIESTGAARANAYTLPYTPITATQIDMKFNVSTASSGWCAIFSGRNTYAGTGISLYKNGDNQHFGYFTGGTAGAGDNFAPFSFDTDYTITADVTKLVLNGETYETGNTTTNATTRNLSLFANPEWDNPMRGRIYYCTISEGGETVYDFQPVMRHDGKFGFYDKTSMTFVLPAQGSLDGYGFKKFDDKAYMTYAADTRIVIVGTTAQFLPDVQNLDGATFEWTSADETIATVAADGTVTGKKAGKVVITVTTDADQGWTASYELTVSEPNYVRYDADGVGYAIVTGGEGWGDSPLSALIDNDATTKFGCSGTGDAWAIIIASEPVAVKQYSFVTGADTYGNPGRTPRSWKLEGSNDNQTWTEIDAPVQNYKAKTSNKEETVFTVNGTDAYKFFKLTAWDFDGGFQLGEFWINEQAHSWGEPVVTAATCTKVGTSVAECADCHALKTVELPMIAHTYANGVCSVCGEKASAPMLLANGATTPYTLKFRHMTGSDNPVEIEAGWNTADFDDSDWDELLMPVGTFGPYKTRWIAEYNTFWFRRTFEIANPAEITKLTVKAVHDDDYRVFVNGTEVAQEDGWTSGENDWRAIDVDPALLVAGKNVVAVYIEQNFGGAYCDFSLEAEAGAKVAVSDAKYATFVAPCDVDASAVKTYAVTDVAEGWVTLTEIADKAVPAGAAVVIEAEEGNYTLPKTTDVAALAQNELKAATAAIDVTEANKQYVLADGTDGVGFYPVKVGTTIAAGKGYLEVTETGAKFYALGGEETDVRGLIIENLDGTQTIYNLNGQKMEKAQKGVNIVNGHKFIVK